MSSGVYDHKSTFIFLTTIPSDTLSFYKVLVVNRDLLKVIGLFWWSYNSALGNQYYLPFQVKLFSFLHSLVWLYTVYMISTCQSHNGFWGQKFQTLSPTNPKADTKSMIEICEIVIITLALYSGTRVDTSVSSFHVWGFTFYENWFLM